MQLKAMNTKPLAIIIAILSFILSNKLYAYDFESGGFYFNFKDSGEEVILKAPVQKSNVVVIPTKVTFRGREFNIASIGDRAFANNGITELYFQDGDGVRDIGDEAFDGNKFPQLILPDCVNTIGESAFANNANLKTVQLSAGLVASPYWRTLRFTFANCPNIDTIVICTPHPIHNIADYPPFDKMVRKFAQVFVPYNSYHEYEGSLWETQFSLPLQPYLREGEEAELLPFVKLNWDDNKVTETIALKGHYYRVIDYYGKTEKAPVEFSFSVMPTAAGDSLIRIDLSNINGSFFYESMMQSFPDKYFLYKSKNDSTPTNQFEAEGWIGTANRLVRCSLNFN